MNAWFRLTKSTSAFVSTVPFHRVMASSSSASVFTFPNGSWMRLPLLPAAISDRYIPGQMHKYRDSLPSLPVMPLEQTLNKYLLAVEPLLTPEELERTREAVHEFKRPGGVGEQLQKKLIKRAKQLDNWLIDWWNHTAYFAYRETVVVNVTPAIAYPLQWFDTRQHHIEFATKLILSLMKVFQLVQMEALTPDVYRGKPYCMWQYPRLYGCRIPGKNADTFSQSSLPKNRHITVIRKGNIYKIKLFYDTPDGEIVLAPASFIMEQLQWILEDATERPQNPVGLLTTFHRDKWFEARERLLKDPVNRSSVDAIENTLMMFCLDEAKPDIKRYIETDSSFSTYGHLIATRALHGNGTVYNTINRWFDCISQIVIGEDGGCGSILEHCALDGPAGMFSSRFALDLIVEHKYDFFGEPSGVSPASLEPAERLDWNISADSACDIQEASRTVDKLINNVDFHVTSFDEFGQDLPKSFKLSPDGFVQMAIQLAYYKIYGKTTATYESGGIRWFKYGRTDTIRSTSNASHSFVKAMTNPMSSVTERCKLLVEAVKAHSQYTVDAISGEGVDRHLLGLRILANDAGTTMPKIFTDPSYGKSLHFGLSTSQVPVPNHDICLGFGAVVPDGYGVCYNPQKKKFLICISSYFDCSDTDSKLFTTKLEESFREMRDTLLAANTPTAKL